MRLVPKTAEAYGPVFSPDGSQIALLRELDNSTAGVDLSYLTSPAALFAASPIRRVRSTR